MTLFIHSVRHIEKLIVPELLCLRIWKMIEKMVQVSVHSLVKSESN